jgi:RND superfamily putative drug exporter
LGRPVVIAAAIIMVAVFGGFAFSHITMIKPMGFGLAIGVLIDAFLVRLLLVPALMSVIGKAAWYLPKWLDRLLPDVDVEGAKLERSRSQA